MALQSIMQKKINSHLDWIFVIKHKSLTNFRDLFSL